jgi:hypothetical protein
VDCASFDWPEYLAIEQAIAATAKGRAFLRQRDEVNRVIAANHVGELIRNLQIGSPVAAKAAIVIP